MKDFNSVLFVYDDYMKMVSIHDEISCILRAQLLLEEVLDVWIRKHTKTDKLLDGCRPSFGLKLNISKNLGFDKELSEVFTKITKIRNDFGHRRNWSLENSQITMLKNVVDKLFPSIEIIKCEEMGFQLFTEEGKIEEEYSWDKSNNRIKFILIFSNLMMKLNYYLQAKFG